MDGMTTAALLQLAAVAVGLLSVLLNKRKPPRADAAQVNRSSLLGGLCCGFFLATATILCATF